MQNSVTEVAVYNTAIYVRLSKEDMVAAQSGRESNSITNQKQLILDYLKDKPEFNIVSIRIDDGYTGTNFDRPAFQRMGNTIIFAACMSITAQRHAPRRRSGKKMLSLLHCV